jgi:hypothetical protein
MMILEVLEASKNLARASAPYTWACFGTEAEWLELGTAEEPWGACVFDRNTGVVYALELFDIKGSRAWHWIDPLWLDLYVAECQKRDIDPDQAWPGVKYQLVDNPQLMIVGLGELSGSIQA